MSRNMSRDCMNRDGMNYDSMNRDSMNCDSIYHNGMNRNVSQGGRHNVIQGRSRDGGQFINSAEADKENVGNAHHY
jgi:hypothetical protein